MTQSYPKRARSPLFAAALKSIGVLSLAVSGIAPGLSATPARADHAVTVAEAVRATEFSPDEFLAVFDHAELPGLGKIGPAPAITEDKALDARIRDIGEIRGYTRRPLPSRPLVSVGNHLLQPEAAAGWATLKVAATEAGFNIQIVSAYRNHTRQAAIYRRHAKGSSDAAIHRALGISAVPGYSKHHTGYAIDVSDGTNFNSFGNTPAYDWMAADNFANAKAHGWVPSYPKGSGPAGPNPEPWEFVWVGNVNIICGDFEPTPQEPFCDTTESPFAADVNWLFAEGITTGCATNRFCGEQSLTRGQAATLLWRYAGKPEAEIDPPFVDVAPEAYYAQAARWLFAEELTNGTSRTTFDPGRQISRGEFVTLLWRFANRPEPSFADVPLFADVPRSNFAAKAVAWAAEHGITTLAKASTPNGDALPRFSPTIATTREQVAAFVHRFAIYQDQSQERSTDDPGPTA